MLDGLARLSLRRPRTVIAVAALSAALALALGLSIGGKLFPYNAADPSSESTRAGQRVHELLGLDPDVGLVALVETEQPVRSEASRVRVERIADRVFLDPAVAFVTTYWSNHDPAMVSRDGHATFVMAHFATLSDLAQQNAAARLRRELGTEQGVRLGGEAPANVDVKETVTSDIVRAQVVAVPLLLLLGFWVFRGFAASAIPIGIAAITMAISVLGLRVANAILPVSVFALNLVLGLALALSVDYGLLMISRYREEIARSGPGEEALRRTMATAGRTVLFSALVIGAALSALLLFPQRFLYSMGLGGVLVALVSGVVALTALPALLALLGERINALSPGRLRRAADAATSPARTGAWYRHSQLVMRRPASIAVLSAAVLIALGAPFLNARFAAVDVTALPANAESRQVREALDERFPPNLTLPLFAVLDSPAGSPATGDLVARLRQLPGTERVDAAIPLDERTALVRATSTSAPTSEESERLVEAIRGTAAPFEVLVGGRAAEFVDQREGIAAHLPLVLAVLCGATLIVIFAMTGSLVLSLKSVIVSLLSLAAAFGTLVVVFQEGRLESLLGFESTGALELSMPLVLLAVGFGISTDYGVILLSRIKEAHDGGATNRDAIALGLERSARILTAAALLLCVALGALATSRITFVKELGLGVALTVLLDATIVRALLVPSLMALLGRWNWWPEWRSPRAGRSR